MLDGEKLFINQEMKLEISLRPDGGIEVFGPLDDTEFCLALLKEAYARLKVMKSKVYVPAIPIDLNFPNNKQMKQGGL
jgi:hypothetical protein